MKVNYRVPTRQYAYIDITEDVDPIDPKKIVERYFEFEEVYRAKVEEKQAEEQAKAPFKSEQKAETAGGPSREHYLKQAKDRADAKAEKAEAKKLKK